MHSAILFVVGTLYVIYGVCKSQQWKFGKRILPVALIALGIALIIEAGTLALKPAPTEASPNGGVTSVAKD